jgi:3-hydroxyisobutyrate dehydrogenase
MSKITWIGLGNMGIPMVRNLAKSGYSVTAYNRTKKDIDLGNVNRVDNVNEAINGADVLFIMVSDGSAVLDILFGVNEVGKHLKKGAIVVNMSTIGVDETKEIADRLQKYDVNYVDAPVSGSVKPAENATLVVLAGGDADTFAKVAPMLEKMGKSVHHLGPVGSGAAMKLLVNGFLGVTVEAASECAVMAEQSGLSREKFLNVLSETAVWSPILAAKKSMWLEDQYDPAFALKHQTKDLGLAAGFAAQTGVSVPTILAAFGAYFSAKQSGLEEEDMAAAAKYIASVSGSRGKRR